MSRASSRKSQTKNGRITPSRVLKKNPDPPPIESFAFNSVAQPTISDQSCDDCVEIQHLDRDSNLEDYDVEPDDAGPINRARRFIVDDDEDEVDDDDVKDGDENGFEEVFDVESSEEEFQEDDVVGKALQKCAKMSAELRKELYGSSGASCERYAEVEASSVRIVTQNDIDIACGAVDSDFQPVLKPYQLVGVNFLLLLHQKGIGGAILADDMGLGKTIQAITYLTLLNHLKNDPGPHLIVCPASLLENWKRELKKWCPSFSVLHYHGTGRAAYSKELSSLSKAGLPPPFNVLLVCYSLFERHSGFLSVQQKDDRKILKRWHWSCVLMDEAHALKDKNSYRWKNLMSVARNAKQRLMLTGTPLQNDLHELWSMLEFMMPDLFATDDVDLKKLLNAEDRELIGRMKSILGPFILRRLKSDVMQQLVPKIQQVEYVIMEKQQENAYREAIEEYRTISRARIAKLSEPDLNNIVGIIPRRQISNYFVQFRKIANHPLLVRRIYDECDVCFAKRLHSMGVFECILGRVVEELKNYSDFSIHQTLAELLPSLKRSGHRVLIFSQWTSMLDILEWTLDVIGVTYRRLDGSTQVTDRQTIVDDFNNDTSIFACLLSTRAGGQGLNLTGADTVVIHDMDFNPQIDRQAEDRCHRIGQTSPVTIYRLVTKGTIDENVYEIAKTKLTLDAAVLESGMDVLVDLRQLHFLHQSKWQEAAASDAKSDMVNLSNNQPPLCGVYGLSSLLKTKTPIAATTNAKF
ncbi:Protein CHROMATIN REMODELING 19 [Hibiscus syriacus]|uniref:Protein CHROMATIN REMODELING 19 n=1 Tax=Hibiscus syriacus TaxID=106335 RepID=A0A6A3ANJ9_HIBSY|nr:Protein CHROMATIN REMODELING 19 [Hibiscus syriacus]